MKNIRLHVKISPRLLQLVLAVSLFGLVFSAALPMFPPVVDIEPQIPECRTTRSGVDYAGTIDHTADNITCDHWASHANKSFFHFNLANFSDNIKSFEDASNYCRSPDGNGPPWCYVINGTERAYCDVPICNPNDCFYASNSSYTGGRNITKYGKRCSTWIDALSKVGVLNINASDLRVKRVEEAENFCRLVRRNKFNEPWCYPENSTVPTMCDVPLCDPDYMYDNEDFGSGLSSVHETTEAPSVLTSTESSTDWTSSGYFSISSEATPFIETSSVFTDSSVLSMTVFDNEASSVSTESFTSTAVSETSSETIYSESTTDATTETIFLEASTSQEANIPSVATVSLETTTIAFVNTTEYGNSTEATTTEATVTLENATATWTNATDANTDNTASFVTATQAIANTTDSIRNNTNSIEMVSTVCTPIVLNYTDTKNMTENSTEAFQMTTPSFNSSTPGYNAITPGLNASTPGFNASTVPPYNFTYVTMICREITVTPNVTLNGTTASVFTTPSSPYSEKCIDRNGYQRFQDGNDIYLYSILIGDHQAISSCYPFEFDLQLCNCKVSDPGHTVDIEEVEEQASELENNINDAVSSGNTEKAVDTIGSVLASLSFASDPKMNTSTNSGNAAQQIRTEVRNALVDAVLTVASSNSSGDSGSYQKMAAVLKTVASVPDELDNETLSNILKASTEVTKKMASAPLDEVIGVVGLLANATTSVLDAAIPDFTQTQTGSSSELNDQQKKVVKDIAENTEKLLNEIAGTIFKKMPQNATGQVKIENEKLDMVLTSVQPNDTKSISVKTKDGSVKLPDTSGDGNVAALNVKMFLFRKNIYSHGSNSKSVNSYVMTLDIKYADGKEFVSQEPFDAEISTGHSNTVEEDPIDSGNITTDYGVYHTISVVTVKVSMMLTIQLPNDSPKYKILGQFGRNPSDEDNIFKFVISDRIEEASRTWNVKEKLRGEKNETLTIFIPASELTAIGKLVVLVLKLEETGSEDSSPSNPSSSRRLLSIPGSNSSYSFEPLTVQPKMWNKNTDTWDANAGLEVSDESTKSKVVFKSNFFGSFASGLFIPPNTIKFDYVITNFAELLSENPYVLIVMCVLIAVYFLLLIWARRADRKDKIQWEYAPLLGNQPTDRYIYRISVFTGMRSGAGTSANVFMTLSGDCDTTKPRVLMDGYRKNFLRGSTNNFLLSYPSSLGNLQNIQIWHDAAGDQPGWYLSKIIVFDIQEQKRYYFYCEDWLAFDHGDGSVTRILPVTAEDDLKTMSRLMPQHSKLSFFDDHVWVSVFNRPIQSSFTRIQRLSVCLSVLFLTMLVSCMWYKNDVDVETGSVRNSGIVLGPIRLTYEQIYVGLIGSLIVVPPTYFMMQIFKRTKPKPKSTCCSCLSGKNYTLQYNTLDLSTSGLVNGKVDNGDELMKIKNGDVNKEKLKLNGSTNNQTLKSETLKCENDTNDKKKKKRRLRLPWWFVFIAYATVLITVFVGAFFTLFYSLSWGKEKSINWLLSWVFSFMESMLFIQPLKVIIVATVLSCILKIPNEEAGDIEDEENDLILTSFAHVPDSSYKIPDDLDIPESPPDPAVHREGLERRKIEFERDNRLFDKLKAIGLHLLYLGMLIWICYDNRDSNFFLQNRAIINSLELDDVELGRFDDIWSFLEESVLPSVYPSTLYNGLDMDEYDKAFISNMAAWRVGPLQLRQLRVEPDTCSVLDPMSLATNSCNDEYSKDVQQTLNYEKAWKAITNHTSGADGFMYTLPKLFERCYSGLLNSYDAGGYVKQFQFTGNEVLNEFETLKASSWLDRLTRVVFIEFVVNNENVKVFTAVKLVIEIPASGGMFFEHRLTSFRPYPYTSAIDFVLLIIQLAWCILVMYFLIKQFILMKKQGCAYWKIFWNYMDVIHIILAAISIIFYIVRIVYIVRAVEQVLNNKGTFVSFDEVAMVDEGFTVTVAIVMFIATLQLFKALNFNKTLAVLKSTMKMALGILISYFMIFLILYWAFIQAFHIATGYTIADFRSYLTSFYGLFLYMLGILNYTDSFEDEEAFAIIFFTLFVVITKYLIANIFVAVLNVTLYEVTTNDEMQDYDKELTHHLWYRLRNLWSSVKKNGKKVDPVPEEAKETSDDDDLDDNGPSGDITRQEEVKRKKQWLQNRLRAARLGHFWKLRDMSITKTANLALLMEIKFRRFLKGNQTDEQLFWKVMHQYNKAINVADVNPAVFNEDQTNTVQIPKEDVCVVGVEDDTVDRQMTNSQTDIEVPVSLTTNTFETDELNPESLSQDLDELRDVESQQNIEVISLNSCNEQNDEESAAHVTLHLDELENNDNEEVKVETDNTHLPAYQQEPDATGLTQIPMDEASEEDDELEQVEQFASAEETPSSQTPQPDNHMSVDPTKEELDVMWAKPKRVPKVTTTNELQDRWFKVKYSMYLSAPGGKMKQIKEKGQASKTGISRSKRKS